jgi:hypothetical protein
MARLCENIVGDHDTDISELLYKHVGRKELEQAMCHDLSSACTQQAQPFTGSRPDEDFTEEDPEHLNMMRMMAQMEEQGMSGTVGLRAHVTAALCTLL